jgi:hypothetical protein
MKWHTMERCISDISDDIDRKVQNIFKNYLAFSFLTYTGCGIKNSPIVETNKNQTQHDSKKKCLIINSAYNAIFNYLVLKITSLKWLPPLLMQ